MTWTAKNLDSIDTQGCYPHEEIYLFFFFLGGGGTRPVATMTYKKNEHVS